MSVSNGQIANQNTFNNAFVSKQALEQEVDGTINLTNADSGADIENLQQTINDAKTGIANNTSEIASINNELDGAINTAIGLTDAGKLLRTDADGFVNGSVLRQLAQSFPDDAAANARYGGKFGGEVYYNSTDNVYKEWSVDAGAWVTLGSSAASNVALDELTDVDAGAPLDGDVLTFDAGTDEWRPQSISASLSGFSTGDCKISLKSVADTGWVLANDGTIGSATSGATTRASADTENLFLHMWNTFSNTIAPVSGGRGASAAADWAANKNIKLGTILGRALGVAGAGSGLTSRSLGQSLGSETHSLTASENGTHTHTQNAHEHTFYVPNGGYSLAPGSSGDWLGAMANTTAGGVGKLTPIEHATATNQNSGNGDPHNNMQPTVFLTLMIKL